MMLVFNTLKAPSQCLNVTLNIFPMVTCGIAGKNKKKNNDAKVLFYEESFSYYLWFTFLS